MPRSRYRFFLPMFLVGLLLLIATPILRVLLLMAPIPLTQEKDLIGTAYYVDMLYPYLAILGALMVGPQIVHVLRTSPFRLRLGILFLGVFLAGLNYMAAFKMVAAKMFVEPTRVVFAKAATNKVPLDKLVVGLERGGVAKAYPIYMMAYHHIVQDSVAGTPVLVTYCSLCRTGRVFNPIINGVHEHFRLVGIQHYNAMLEDGSTRSWWYQATGTAAYGERTGMALEEFPSEQMTLKAWLAAHPESLVLQPDTVFNEVYARSKDYEAMREDLDSTTGKMLHWQPGSWVVGIEQNKAARAWDWNHMRAEGVINDTVGGTPVVVAMAGDTINFCAFSRVADGATLTFAADSAGRGLRDAATGSLWNWSGQCIEGASIGKRLARVAAHQQYWHAWETFHPTGTRYKP